VHKLWLCGIASKEHKTYPTTSIVNGLYNIQQSKY